MTGQGSLRLIGLLVLGMAAGAPAGVMGAEDKGDGTVIRTEEGLRFRLPADWPVEKRGSVVAPVPVEEYLSKKFSAVDARLRLLEQQLAGFDLRLRVMEEALKEQHRLRSSEPPSP